MYILHHYPDTASLILRLILRELDQPYAERLIDRASGALEIGRASCRERV